MNTRIKIDAGTSASDVYKQLKLSEPMLTAIVVIGDVALKVAGNSDPWPSPNTVKALKARGLVNDDLTLNEQGWQLFEIRTGELGRKVVTLTPITSSTEESLALLRGVMVAQEILADPVAESIANFDSVAFMEIETNELPGDAERAMWADEDAADLAGILAEQDIDDEIAERDERINAGIVTESEAARMIGRREREGIDRLIDDLRELPVFRAAWSATHGKRKPSKAGRFQR